jgi:hypothetical protein
LVGSTQEIQWISSGTTGRVNIGFSFDNGTTWTYVQDTEDDGSYMWTIPNNPSTNCIVEVSNRPWDFYDKSDAVFTISAAPAIFVIVPDGGEDLHTGESVDIEWNSVETSGNVKIEFSSDNGTSWSDIIASTADDGVHPWTVPDITSDNCLIRVSDVDGDPQGVCESVFSISPVPFVTVISPNGGEDFLVGTTQEIQWTSQGTAGNVNIGFSFDNGKNWTYVQNTPDDGSYMWTIPDNPSDSCIVEVSNISWDFYDKSDAMFTISPIPEMTVTSPDGGEEWYVGTSQEITWSSAGTSGNVSIEYSTDNGTSWTDIIASTSDDGIHPWTVPDNASENCLVRISDVDGDPEDISDAVFTILHEPFISISSPGGGEVFQAETTFEITWTSSGTKGNVHLWLSIDGGNDWDFIEQSTPDDGSYMWTIPNTPSRNCMISVSDTDYDPFDETPVFTIVEPGASAVDQISENKMICYPNPCTDHINLEFNESWYGNTFVQITDIQGQVVLQQNYIIMENDLSIDLQDLSNGMYILEVINSEESLTTIIIKE